MRLRTCRCIIVALSIHGVAYAAEPPPKKPVAEVIPYTAANLHGQASVYREGWFVVTSTEKTLSYAKEHGVTSAGQALSRALADAGQHGAGLGAKLAAAGQNGADTTKQVFAGGTALTAGELAATHRAAQAEIDYGSRAMARAWDHLIQGNLTLVERTEEDRRVLMAITGNYFAQLKADYSNLHELSEKAKAKMSTHIEGNWDQAFHEARLAFDQSYQASGERHNSLSALGDIMGGYVKVVYSGVAKPAARSTVQGAEATAKIGSAIVFLPVAGLVVTERTVKSAGLTVYYACDMGVKLVSPTVESGLLAGLSILSYGAVPATYLAGGSAGVVNEITVTAAAPIAGAGKAVAAGTDETAQYAARVSYDLGRGVTSVALNETQAGIALGYNALTQLSAQTLLSVANGAVFVATGEAGKLVLASARGEVQWHDDKGETGGVPVESVPVGSVVDLNALKARGAAVEVIDADPETIQKVLKTLPQDLRAGGQP